ncbi:MAG: hypothetical protein JJU18_13400 [Oceanicaulis sp.]|nr:hypothetical protein [Oceanicaulis sp.]
MENQIGGFAQQSDRPASLTLTTRLLDIDDMKARYASVGRADGTDSLRFPTNEKVE